ncbi:hypothetical protein CB1_000849028 [Camelus ferus]|nr:hypothetical protein CB1_000849028 [Camelus ferus]
MSRAAEPSPAQEPHVPEVRLRLGALGPHLQTVAPSAMKPPAHRGPSAPDDSTVLGQLLGRTTRINDTATDGVSGSVAAPVTGARGQRGSVYNGKRAGVKTCRSASERHRRGRSCESRHGSLLHPSLRRGRLSGETLGRPDTAGESGQKEAT